MLFNIPQFIDKEDKIVGPFTAKQLGWMACAVVAMLVLWSLFDFAIFLVGSLFILVIFGTLAFYRPNNQPFITFVVSSFSFASRPKMYVWRRMPEKIIIKKAPKKETAQPIRHKEVNRQKIEEIAKILDRQQTTDNK